MSVRVTLLGVTLASCTLSPDNPGCTVGGSVDGFKAEANLRLQQDAWTLVINGELCVPVAGCKSVSVRIPFGWRTRTASEGVPTQSFRSRRGQVAVH